MVLSVPDIIADNQDGSLCMMKHFLLQLQLLLLLGSILQLILDSLHLIHNFLCLCDLRFGDGQRDVMSK